MTSNVATTSSGRILILTPDLRGTGGVVSYFNTLRLHELGDFEYFYVNAPDRQSDPRAILRVAVTCWRLAIKLLANRYSLVHLNPSLSPRSFFRDGILLMLVNMSRTPALVFFRGWDPDFASRIERSVWLRCFSRQTYGRCRNFIVLGNLFKERLPALGIGNARVWLETTVADARPGHEDGVRAKIRAPRKEMTVLFMSRLLVSKGVLLAIEAVSQYQASRSPGEIPLRLWIAGTGDDEQRVRRYVDSKQLNFVEFLGHLGGPAKWDALEAAHIFLFPTCYPEGMSNAVLEAMIHALPVITRPEGSMAEVIQDGVNGFLTPSVDPAVFAGYLRMLASDPELYNRMATANLNMARHRFARAEVASRLLRTYAEIQN